MSRDQNITNLYKENAHHLADELKRLDLLIRQRLNRMRSRSRGIGYDPKLYVSHEEVDHLLGEPASGPEPAPGRGEEALAIFSRQIEQKVAASIKEGVFLGLHGVAQLFGLSGFERMVIVICMAPELRRKYEKIYVYLQDDIAAKRPAVDMVLNLLCGTEAEKWRYRRYFSADAMLIRAGILEIIEDPQAPLGAGDLFRYLKLSTRFLDYILGRDVMDEALITSGAAKLMQGMPLNRVLVDEEIKTGVMNVTRTHLEQSSAERKPLVHHFHGPRGAGKRELARGICDELNISMLYLDMELTAAAGAQARHLLRTAMRESVLRQVMVYMDHLDCLNNESGLSNGVLKWTVEAIREFGWLIVLAGESAWAGEPGIFDRTVFLSTHLPVPGVELRRRAWLEELKKYPQQQQDTAAAERMAHAYRLTPGQIHEAVQQAHYRGGLSFTHLSRAGRGQSNRKLSELAVKVESNRGWDDIVLPQEKITRLMHICGQVKHRHRVLYQWGFASKSSQGNGLSVLFSGAPGTGKTMAAGVMARELQLDLYKIDLSAVVSKYIGETEKNLSRIFNEAESSNAILFFDEADALFGKRSEVNDAHDRYANIETSYLLQKMEAYDGIVILATNFRKNMDDAFTRRIRYILDFPFPDEESRKHIWQCHFPAAAPLGEAVDFDFLARGLPVSGGHIKNIILDAAFLAAQNGGVIGMEQLLEGARKEYEKMGKLWDNAAAKQL